MPKVTVDTTLEPYKNGFRGSIRKFGRVVGAGAVDTVVWDGATPYLGWLAAEDDIEIVSDDAADAVGGLGCQYLQITGQGEDGIEKTYSMTLNGTTPVLLSTTDPGVKFDVIYTAQCVNTEGTNLLPTSAASANLGTITIRSATTPTNVMAIIKPNRGRTQMVIWRCPSDKYGEFEKMSIYPISGKPLAARLMGRDDKTLSWICFGEIDFSDTSQSIKHPFPDYISPGTDLCLVITPTAASTTCSAQMWIKTYPIIAGE